MSRTNERVTFHLFEHLVTSSTQPFAVFPVTSSLSVSLSVYLRTYNGFRSGLDSHVDLSLSELMIR